MRSISRSWTLLLASLALAACANSPPGGGGGGAGGDDGDTRASGRAVQGNVQITLQTQTPSTPIQTFAFVNATSEIGRRITSGRATSTVIRVLSDADMAKLIEEIESRGFSSHAVAGRTLKNLPDASGRRGVIVVEENGASRALDFGTGSGGGALPTCYLECKKLILGVHGALQGLAVSGTTTNSADDGSKVFQAPPIKLPRR